MTVTTATAEDVPDFDIAYPSGIQEGDLLVLVVASDATSVEDALDSTITSGALNVQYRIASGGESGNLNLVGDGANFETVAAILFNIANLNTAVLNFDTTASSYVAPSVANTPDGVAIVIGMAGDTDGLGDEFTSIPSGTTLIETVDFVNSAPSNDGRVRIFVAEYEYTTNPTGTKTFGGTGGTNGKSVTIAIKYAGASVGLVSGIGSLFGIID